MKVYKVDFGYIWDSSSERDRKLTIRKKSFEIIGIEWSEDFEQYGTLRSGDHPIITQEQLLAITELNEDFTIVQTIQVSDPLNSAVERFEKAVEKLSQIPTQDIAYNEKCEVHVPNMPLLLYNETLLLEDSCTDALQNRLDEGWRIIAACPQPQRRPDYILGRYNPERDIDRLGSGSRRG